MAGRGRTIVSNGRLRKRRKDGWTRPTSELSSATSARPAMSAPPRAPSAGSRAAPTTLRDRDPVFAARWDEALRESRLRLHSKLIVYAETGGADPVFDEDGEAVDPGLENFDPDLAFRLLKFHADSETGGRRGRAGPAAGQRGGIARGSAVPARCARPAAARGSACDAGDTGRSRSAAGRIAPARRTGPGWSRGWRRGTGRRCCTIWPAWAHDGQMPPEGEWRIWLMMAGRGFGKTRAGAEWVSALARERPDAAIALVGATPAEVERVMIRGTSGLMAVARARRGCALLFDARAGGVSRAGRGPSSIRAPTRTGLRGPEHDFAWCDELAKWAYPERGLGQSDARAAGAARARGR